MDVLTLIQAYPSLASRTHFPCNIFKGHFDIVVYDTPALTRGVALHAPLMLVQIVVDSYSHVLIIPHEIDKTSTNQDFLKIAQAASASGGRS